MQAIEIRKINKNLFCLIKSIPFEFWLKYGTDIKITKENNNKYK